MRQLTILAIVAIGCAAADFIKPDYMTEFAADKDFLLKQKKIYEILYHLGQPELKQDLYKMGQEYKLESRIDDFTNKELHKDFLHRYEHGFLPKDAVYSVFYPKMMEETFAMYKLLYSAKDFDTFYKTALWLRNRMNPAMFGYSFYLAVIQRPDTKYLRLPPIYELMPHYYYNTELFEHTHHIKRFGKLAPKHSAGYDTYIVPYNYSGHYMTHEYNYEQRLNYFTEDIGLNTFYFFLRAQYPFFLKSSEIFANINYRGEEYLYAHKHLFNRYYLERLSNDLPVVEEYDYDMPFYPGYYPSMAYPNGLPFPVRPWESYLPKQKLHEVHTLQEYELRIGQAIDAGYVFTKEGKMVNIYTPEGLNILGNMLEGNADSPNKQYYGQIEVLSRNVLGGNMKPSTPYKTQPSALEHFVTSMRDPAFWRLYSRITEFYHRYKAIQKPYKPEQYRYSEYKIESVDVDKLLTYFDYYDSTISNGLAVDNEKEAEAYLIQARQSRLNHKHFNVHLNINAEKAGKAAVRIFLGPRFHTHEKEMKFADLANYFYEMDYFIYDFASGVNKVERNCHDFFYVDSEMEPSEVFYKKLIKSIESGEEMKLQKRIYGFPQRLLLPKGKPEGMPFQLFVIVTPVTEMGNYSSRVFGDSIIDNRPFGYPLDRPISEYEFHGPNMYFKDVLIYHKMEHDLTVTN